MDQHNVDKNVTLVMAEEAAPVVHLTAVPKAPAVVAAAANRGRPSGSKNKKVRHMAMMIIDDPRGIYGSEINQYMSI